MPMSIGAAVVLLLAFQVSLWEMCVSTTGKELSGGRI